RETSTHQPAHEVYPGAHVVPQVPPEHVGISPPLAGHTTDGPEQPPQCEVELERSTHAVPHAVAGGTHAATHPVAEQKSPPVHVVPHAPHEVADERSDSQPSDASPLQSAQPL